MPPPGWRFRTLDEAAGFLLPLQRRRGIRFGLANVRRCLAGLGDPQRRFASVHVVGTKGKGSTAAFLHGILAAAGHRAALYTSPHLLDFRERFVVGREEAPPADILESFRRVAAASGNGEDIPLTFFEWVTAMAFDLFARRGIEVAVLEAGMGGRLDATRVAGGPLVLLGMVGLDHREFLGQTPAVIAREKVAVVAPGAAMISAAQEGAVRRVVERTCRGRRVSLTFADDEALLEVHGTDLSGTGFDLALPGRRLPRLWVPLPGRHQATNAALAVLGAERLADMGFPADDDAVRRGLASCRLRGRLETLGEGPTVILDVAHNPDSFAALAAFLGEALPGVRPELVLAVMADKDLPGMLRRLAGLNPRVWAARCRNERSAASEAVAEAARQGGLEVAGVFEAVPAALDAARGATRECVVVAGSTFTAGEALRNLRGLPPPEDPGVQ